MAEEVELKLTLAEKEQQRFLRHPLLKQAVHRQTETLDNIYYDTPDLALRRHGIALRLRRQGRHWLQTVKLAGTAAAGLASRPEWEIPYAGQFDFSAITEKKVRTWLQRPRLLAQLAPVFDTRFQRQTWRFVAAPGAVLLTLDRGWITAGQARTAISEIELELANAPLNALFDLALPLTESLVLTPAVRSKAERGYQLHSRILPQPVKAAEILQTSVLTSHLSPLAAFRNIALTCLEHLQQNYHGALHTEDPEYIHQMRVAMRRLRAALRIFSPLLPTRFTSALKDAFTPLMVQLGQVRDLDVLYAEIAAPVLAAMANKPRSKDQPPLASLLSAIDQQRQHTRQQAMALLDSPAYGHALLSALQTLHQQETSASTSAPKLSRFAAKRLRSTSKNVSQRIRSADYENPASLHDLRIAIKRLRYALDFFSSLTPLKNLQPILPQLIPLQETLGQLNDLSQAGKWLMAYAGEDTSLREAVTLIGNWHGKRHAQLLASLPLALRHLERTIENI